MTNTNRAPKLNIRWIEPKPGIFQTRTVDPRNGKTYLSHPVPRTFAVKLGMKPENTDAI
jgi:hypothetical protein